MRVPFIVRGPGVKPNSFSKAPVVGYDLMPTFLELIKPGFKLPDVVEGGSFLPVLENGGKGEVKRANDFILFHFPNGIWPAMSSFIAGNHNLVYAWNIDRVQLFDLDSDISEQNDLSTGFPEKTQLLNEEMLDYLKSVDAFIPPEKELGNDRKRVGVGKKKPGRKKKEEKSAKKKAPGNYLTLQAPEQVVAGTTATVIITHEIPPELGEQKIHVGLKSDKQKIKRHVRKAKGTGTLEVSFEVPESTTGKPLQFGAFIGKDYQHNLQHLTSDPVLVK